MKPFGSGTGSSARSLRRGCGGRTGWWGQLGSDEVFLRINGVQHYLRRAVDQHGIGPPPNGPGPCESSTSARGTASPRRPHWPWWLSRGSATSVDLPPPSTHLQVTCQCPHRNLTKDSWLAQFTGKLEVTPCRFVTRMQLQHCRRERQFEENARRSPNDGSAHYSVERRGIRESASYQEVLCARVAALDVPLGSFLPARRPTYPARQKPLCAMMPHLCARHGLRQAIRNFGEGEFFEVAQFHDRPMRLRKTAQRLL